MVHIIGSNFVNTKSPNVFYLFSKLINAAVPDTVDIRALNIPSRNIYHRNENLNLAINAARAIGCTVINIGTNDIAEGQVYIYRAVVFLLFSHPTSAAIQPVLILGIIWQIVRISLLSAISLKAHPELVRLLLDGETMEDFMKLPPDQILLRWVNYHLKNSSQPDKRISNFGNDIKDSEAYSLLLHQLSPNGCALVPAGDPLSRAAGVIRNATVLGVEAFVAPSDIAAGNSKLNLGFVAQVFLPSRRPAGRLTLLRLPLSPS